MATAVEERATDWLRPALAAVLAMLLREPDEEKEGVGAVWGFFIATYTPKNSSRSSVPVLWGRSNYAS